jgi:hypothetical protein
MVGLGCGRKLTARFTATYLQPRAWILVTLMEVMENELVEITANNTSVEAVEIRRISLRSPPEPKVTGSTPVGITGFLGTQVHR